MTDNSGSNERKQSKGVPWSCNVQTDMHAPFFGTTAELVGSGESRKAVFRGMSLT